MNLLPHREMPYFYEAERGALGAAIVSKKAVPLLLSLLSEDDFYIPAHRMIYRCIRVLFDRNSDVDIITITETLKKFGRDGEAGGIAYVQSVADNSFSSFLPTYAADVKKASRLRGIVNRCRNFEEKAYDTGSDPDALCEELFSELLADRGGERKGPVRLYDALNTEAERIEAGESVPALQFGIDSLDKFCGGVEAKDLGIIAGLPGAGKTAFLHQIAAHSATAWGKTLIFSLEITVAAVSRRNLSRITGYTYREIREARRWVEGVGKVQFGETDRKYLRECIERNAEAMQNLWVDGDSYDLNSIIAESHRLHAKEGLRTIFIDYAQLVDAPNANGKRNIEVEMVARACKNRLATDLNIPVLLISSLTKEGQKRGSLKLADLAESAALEYTASLIMFLVEGKALISKCRNDRRGEVPLTFDPTRFMLFGVDEAQDEPPPDSGQHYAEDY